MTDTKKHIPRNYVSKNLRKSCIPSVIPHKKQEMIAEAVDKEAEKDYSGCCWDEGKFCEQDSLSDISCSNLSVED